MRRASRQAFFFLAVAFVVWTLVGVLTLLEAARDSAALSDAVRDLRSAADVRSLLDGTARERLESVHSDLSDVEDAVQSPAVLPLRAIPGINRQVRSAEALSSAGVRFAAVVGDLLDELETVVTGPLPRAGARLTLLRDVEELLYDSRAALELVPLGPEGPLLERLDEIRSDARDGKADLLDLLGRGEALVHSLTVLLADGEHLLLAANNAEMRAGTGMFLQVGVLDAVRGTLRAEQLQSAGSLRLAPGAVDAGSGTYGELWGFLRPTEEWRNLGASPRFDVTAELAARMWHAHGRDAPHTVLAIDPYAVAALLLATGPVEVAGEQVTAEDVVAHLLHDQYDSHVGAEDVTGALQDERREQLGELVSAALAALEERDIDPVVLLDGLREAVNGRHLLAWSRDPDLQAGWEAAGMSGTLREDSLMVSILNRGANKLDPFLDVEATASFQDHSAEIRLGRLEIVVRNRVPRGEVQYVAGPHPDVPSTEGYGDYAGILSVALPGAARNARIDGVSDLEVARLDGPILTLATKFVLARRSAVAFTVTYEIPPALESVRLEADARPRPVRWRIGGRTVRDGERHRIAVDPKGP